MVPLSGTFTVKSGGWFLRHKFPKRVHLRRQKLIGDFKVKSPQPNTENRIDFTKLLRISAISRGPLDVPGPENC